MTKDPSPPIQNPSANSPDWEAIARFLAGESPAEEAMTVERWLTANPADKELVSRLDSIVTTDALSDAEVEAALSRVHSRMNESASRPQLTIEGNRAPAHWRRVVAVSLLAAAAVAGVVFTTRRVAPVAQSPTSMTALTYRTKIGQRDSVLLADGSRVLLGPDSRLVVPAEYGRTSRTVEMQGDGYFDVRHDAGKAFTVHVGHAVIEDVGTTFTVESDGGDTTSVAVVSGSVRLRAGDSSATSGVLLAAGDRGSIGPSGSTVAKRQAVRNEDTAWTTGRLVLRDASLSRVAGELHRWYGVTLHVADSSLLNRHVTASFTGESVDQVLKIIALTLGAQIERHGDSALVVAQRGRTMGR